MSNRPFRFEPGTSPGRIKRMSHLDHRLVELGETIEIKGDAQRRDQVMTSLQQIVETRLEEAEQEALQIREQRLAAISAEAEQMMENARAEAAAIVAGAEATRESIRSEAEEAGRVSGHAIALAQVRDETRDLILSAQTLLNSAYAAEAEALNQFTHNAVMLMQVVLRRILGDAFAADPKLLAELLGQAVRQLNLTGQIRVVVSQNTLQRIQQFDEQTRLAIEAVGRIDWVPDALLADDAFYVLGEEKQFDISPRVQVENLMAHLADELPLETPEPSTAPTWETPETPSPEATPVTDDDPDA
ncbi:MAG: hypothetical protein AB7P76_08595 [Candidatus Melainabacteria bacterium]